MIIRFFIIDINLLFFVSGSSKILCTKFGQIRESGGSFCDRTKEFWVKYKLMAPFCKLIGSSLFHSITFLPNVHGITDQQDRKHLNSWTVNTKLLSGPDLVLVSSVQR